MKNILVTGGCGFIGSALIRTLLQDPLIKIRAVDNFSVGSLDDLKNAINTDREIQVTSEYDCAWGEGLSVFKCDIGDVEVIKLISQGAEAIVHLAANTGVAPSVENPIYDCKANVLGTLNLLECARVNGIGKFVFASSGAPIGEQEPPISEKSIPRPASPYGASKLAGEGYCSAYYKTFGVNTVALRFGNVYGPGSTNKDSAVAKFIKLALNKQKIEIFGDGTQTRDFIYIEDLVEAIVKSLSVSEIGGELFQIATARETSINELVTALQKCFEQREIYVPKIKNTAKRRGDVQRNYSDTSKAKRELRWHATTDLATGLSNTLTYFLKGTE